MWINEQKLKNQPSWYSISYIDPKTNKRVRMKRSAHPHFSTYDEAEKWTKTQDAAFHAAKQRSQARAAWRTKFYDFAALVDDFQVWTKQKAPSQNGETRKRLEYYVMPFFLETKLCNNVNQWRYFYGEFRSQLDSHATSAKYQKPLSYSYKNHVINALNQFTEWLVEQNKMEVESRILCAHFPRHLIGSRTVEDVLPDDEFKDVHVRLSKTNESAADFFYILRHTGMRFNELWSLPLNALHSGELSGPLHKTLREASVSYVGYIFLESQCAASRKKDGGKYIRRPLKGRKKIDMKGARTVPVMDKTCWNILAKRYKEGKALGKDLGEMLFFEGVTKSSLENALRLTYEPLPYKKKVYHCLRHTYATNFIGETRSYFLAQIILGHRSPKVFDNYNHIFDLMNMRAKALDEEIDFIA